MDERKNMTDPMYGCNGEVVQQIGSGAESILMAFVMILIIMVAIFGNTLVILAVYNFRALHKATFYLLCSLAISDFLSPLFRLLFIALANMKSRWIFGCKWCSASSAIGIFFCSSSIVHLCFITLERFLLIHYPLHHSLWITKRRLAAIISFIWLLSLVVAFLPSLAHTVDMTFNRNILNCEIFLDKHPHLSVLMFGIYFGIPLLMMVVVYAHIFNAAVGQSRKISLNSLGNRSVKRKKVMQQEWKALKMVLIVVGMFLLLWSPYFSISIVKAYAPPSKLPYWVERIALCCAYMNSGCNWIVYSVRNQHVRTAFQKLLHMENISSEANNNIRLRPMNVYHNAAIEFDMRGEDDSHVNGEHINEQYSGKFSNFDNCLINYGRKRTIRFADQQIDLKIINQ